MEKLLDKFLRYVAVETTSDEASETQPSSKKELDLLRLLRVELQQMGIKAELDEYGYVMATIPANTRKRFRPSASLPMSIPLPTPRARTSSLRSSANGMAKTLC